MQIIRKNGGYDLNIPYNRFKEIEANARFCFKKYSTRNAISIFNYCSNIECSSLFLDGNIGGFTHKSEFDDNYFYVCLNNKYDTYSQKIIAAHELGHIVLHGNEPLNTFLEDECSELQEYEANIFAMEFMPQIQPYNMTWNNFTPNELQNYIRSKLRSRQIS